jgi:anion-transporting  ArsA/GET3 family ATPase
MARKRTSPGGLAGLFATKEMVVVCGSGGVGKTTVAAAMGAQCAVTMPGKTLVLTVDPARRLATALGIGAFGNAEVRVPEDAFASAGVQPAGELWVAMLDTKAGWDELIRRHAPDAARRDAVMANSLYRNITSRFVNSHDYIAMEKLHELHAAGRYDVIIIDTPPSRNALDLLDAPSRMREFFGGRLLRWLTVPARSRLFTVASKPFYQVADRVLGSRFLQDIAEFFVLFQSMESGFVARAGEVERLLVDPRTAFVVVSTLEAAPAREARFLADELRRRQMSLGALVLNRVLPPEIRRPTVAKAARLLADRADDPVLLADLLAVLPDPQGDAADRLGPVLSEVADRLRETVIVAAREAERREELSDIAPVVASAPVMPGDITDVAGLLHLGAVLFEPDRRTR